MGNYWISSIIHNLFATQRPVRAFRAAACQKRTPVINRDPPLKADSITIQTLVRATDIADLSRFIVYVLANRVSDMLSDMMGM
jgi:hypothetical protein